SGNIMPASMTMMSSPKRSAIMFMPNSPRPPRGIAKRDCEDLLKEISAPVVNKESYHSGAEERHLGHAKNESWKHPSYSLEPVKRCTTTTRTTAPTVAAASE